MNKQIKFASLFLFVVSSVGIAAEGNLVSPHYFQAAVSYAPATLMWGPWDDRNFAVTDETLQLTSQRQGAVQSATMGVLDDYSTAEALDVSFQYQAQGTASISMSAYHPEKNVSGYVQKEVPPAAEWTNFRGVIHLNRESMGGTFAFSIAGKEAFFNVRKLHIVAREPVDKTGRKLFFGDAECEAIYVLPDENSANTFFDRRAAQIMRYTFNRAGGKLIPVRTIETPEDYQRCAIYVGKAAANTDLLSAEELAGMTDSGYAVRLAGRRLAVAGKRSGTAAGVVEVLKKAGVVYLGQDQYSRPQGASVLSDFAFRMNPAVPIRELSYRVAQPELWGYTAHEEWANLKVLGSHRGNCHAAITYVPLREFENTHPEYFALNSDGQRLHSSQGKNVQTHFCMSNPALQQLLADRVMEVMEADPIARYFYLFPGDGGGYYCRCADCAKLGETTDRLLHWINQIAAITGKKYPDRRVVTLAYVDSAEPPGSVRPADNVIVLYTPYAMRGWGSHLVFEHPANDVGLQQMQAWETLIPKQLGAFTYPNSCTETLNLWPAFDFNLKLDRRLAEKQYQVVAYCGFVPTFAKGSYPQNGSFTSLQMRVLAEVLINPAVDVSSLVDTYLLHAFGPAAPAMRKYFDTITREPILRQWAQNTERRIRGFVTKDLADTAMHALDEAESLAATDPVFRKNVLREFVPMLWSYFSDQRRGNAKLTEKEFPVYAKRLAKYVSTCRELGYSYLVQPTAKDWFWETALLKIGDTRPWYNDPVLEALCRDPEKTLGSVLPFVQEFRDGAYRISNQGIIGGQPMKGTWLRNDGAPVKCFRRPSSGYGTGSLLLRLDQQPDQAGSLLIYGIDNEKPEPAQIEILVNGKSIYRGPAPWLKDAWSEKKIPFEAKVFQAGDNEITLLNRTADSEQDGEGGVNFAAQRDYNWGWFMVENIKIIFRKP